MAVFRLFRFFRLFSFLQGPYTYQHFMLKRSPWGIKPVGFASLLYIPIKHSHLFIKHYILNKQIKNQLLIINYNNPLFSKKQHPYLRKSQGQVPRKDKKPVGLVWEVVFSGVLDVLALM